MSDLTSSRSVAENTIVRSLEAQIADLADEITYYSHDLDDAVDFEILTAAQLEENEVWRNSQRHVLAHYPDVREPELHKLIIRNIIDVQVHDVVDDQRGIDCKDQACKAPMMCAGTIRRSFVTATNWRKANQALRKFLYQNVYYHPRVAEVNQRACEMLKKVFEATWPIPDQLGDVATRRLEKEGLHRTVCDYVAGMTDRYLIEEYARIAGDRPGRGD